jgi:hypothetical protein
MNYHTAWALSERGKRAGRQGHMVADSQAAWHAGILSVSIYHIITCQCACLLTSCPGRVA